MKSHKYILGKTYAYTQWDPEREWLRQPPVYAIRAESGQVYDQYTADAFICREERGSVAIVNGIRADESLVRLRAAINKKNENYINATADRRIKLCKPIYDWTQRDIFLYFYKNEIQYCPIYDAQLFNNEALRVSTPLHAESAKRFDKIKTRDPVFYQQLVNLFPEMLVQERYYKDLSDNKDAVYDKYQHDGQGIREYINDSISDAGQRALALDFLGTAVKIRENKIKGTRNFGGYPYRHIFNAVITGAYKRTLQPKKVPSLADYEFEGLTKEDYEDAKKSEMWQ